MIKEAIGVASTMEEARKMALASLHAPIDADVKVDVIAMPKKKILGLFGGSYERGDNRYGSRYAMARGDGRGRGRNARRDSMGRYSSDSRMMVEELRDLMNDAPDERTKMEFKRFIEKMEQM